MPNARVSSVVPLEAMLAIAGALSLGGCFTSWNEFSQGNDADAGPSKEAGALVTPEEGGTRETDGRANDIPDDGGNGAAETSTPANIDSGPDGTMTVDTGVDAVDAGDAGAIDGAVIDTGAAEGGDDAAPQSRQEVEWDLPGEGVVAIGTCTQVGLRRVAGTAALEATVTGLTGASGATLTLYEDTSCSQASSTLTLGATPWTGSYHLRATGPLTAPTDALQLGLRDVDGGAEISDLATLEVRERAVDLSGGRAAICVALADGTHHCMGSKQGSRFDSPSTYSEQLQPVPSRQHSLDGHRAVANPRDMRCSLDASDLAACTGDRAPATPSGALAHLSSGAAPHGNDGWACGVDASTGAVSCTGTASAAVLGEGLPSAGVSHLASSSQHNCAVVAPGDVLCWGGNGDGVLAGLEDPAESATPIAADLGGLTAASVHLGQQTTCVISTTGALRCWGHEGAVGEDACASNPCAPVTLITEGVTDVALGVWEGCAVVNGSVQCWGVNRGDALNVGASPATSPRTVNGLPEGEATRVALTDEAGVCAIIDGLVYCWGNDTFGALGRSPELLDTATPQDTGLFTDQDITQLKLPGNDGQPNCAIVDGGLYCWGRVPNSDVGLDPSEIPDSPGARLFPTELPGAIKVDSGHQHTLVISDPGDATARLYSLGRNPYGALGLGQPAVGNTVAAPTEVALPAPVTDVAASFDGSCAVASGRLYCWGLKHDPCTLGSCPADGENDVPAPGLVFGPDGSDAPFAGTAMAVRMNWATETCALVDVSGDDRAYCFGNAYPGVDPQLIDGLPTDLVDLSINEAGACALGGDERVYCWAHDETTAQQISGDAFDALSGGAADLHCARREDKSELLCWGSNAAYVLGDAVISSSVLPRAVPGLVGDIGLFTADATYHIPSVCAADSEGLKCWGSNSYRLQANAPFLRREPGLILPWE